eukprot:1373918-Pleurochrysis_carterae.AAC.2
MRKHGHTCSRACVPASTIVVRWASIHFGGLPAEVAVADSMSEVRKLRQLRETTVIVPYTSSTKTSAAVARSLSHILKGRN